MQNINTDILSHGYLVIPKTLLQQQIECHTHQEGELEAFLKMLMKVNYSESKYSARWNKNIPCLRGESLFSYRDWSHIFHWSLGKTYRFIHQLQQKGIIEVIPHSERTILHIRIANYDQWVGPSEARKAKKKEADEKFDAFWEQFHTLTLLPKENVAKAQREWDKLSPEEQQLAIDRIEEYYYHLTNTKFILRACSYLSNKAFLNEYLN